MWLTDFFNLFFPNLCNACGKSLVKDERIICLECYFKLPVTNFHKHSDNPVARIFWGRVDLTSATSYMFFNKGGHVQKLMHRLKYQGSTETGVYLGELLGNELKNSSLYSGVNLVIPVPLHKKRLKQRGYNQSDFICRGIGKSMNIEVDTISLIRNKYTETQTEKSRYSRWENVKDKFAVIDVEKLIGKHLLLVDDVLTTGATLEACAQKLLEIPDVKVSVATLAYAQV